MLISTLVKELEEIKSKHGDLEVGWEYDGTFIFSSGKPQVVESGEFPYPLEKVVML